MSTLDPFDPVDRLVGIGPRLKEALAADGVEKVVDLLFHLPKRYEDRTRTTTVRRAVEVVDTWVLVRGRIGRVRSRHGRRRRLAIVEAVVEDETGAMSIVWFNQGWISKRLRSLDTAYLYGPVRRSRSGLVQLVNPEVDEADEGDGVERVVPVYPRIGPLSGRRLRRLIEQALESASALADPLPADLLDDLRLPGLGEAIGAVHAPRPPAEADALGALIVGLNRRRSRAHRRLAFDELLAFCCAVAGHALRRRSLRAPRCVTQEEVTTVARRLLPFELTRAQRRVVGEIADDLATPSPMARLLQGDVGSGKTVVAFLALLLVADSGHQAALMAPTELLAEQHQRTLNSLLAATPHRSRLLTSSLPARQRREVREELSRGELRVVVGTHALIQETVGFSHLGLVVVDEQHRFGVAQRQALVDKGKAPHLLVMTATPIPRSLALTLYGDLELSVIDELPPGRLPVKTVVRPFAARSKLYEFLRQEIREGGRVYVVYPLIESSEAIDARSLEEAVEHVRTALPGTAVGVLHGRLGRTEQEEVALRFRSGAIQVLLSTTVVEVGVDVPEASVMVVESADRFGLSQLHQLRGRVGRGSRKSWCVLLVDEDVAEDPRRRLEVLCRSSDGFEIAEADLRLRGPGELAGTRQWGPSQFRFADLVAHRELAELARTVAAQLATSGRLDAVKAELARYYPIELDLPAG